MKEIVVPSKISLSKSEKERLGMVKNLPYSLELVELCYFVGNELETHEKAKIYGLVGFIGQTPIETYDNVRLFINHKLQND